MTSVLTLGAGLLLIVSLLGPVPYMWALHLEEKWSALQPKTRSQLESCLSLYSRHEIRPSESMWGRSHVLRDGDRMIQYLLMWRTPLDVVYDHDNRVVQIYTSYE